MADRQTRLAGPDHNDIETLASAIRPRSCPLRTAVRDLSGSICAPYPECWGLLGATPPFPPKNPCFCVREGEGYPTSHCRALRRLALRPHYAAIPPHGVSLRAPADMEPCPERLIVACANPDGCGSGTGDPRCRRSGADARTPTQAGAQDRDRKYQVGIRSGLIMGTMELSGLDPAFDDLEFDGIKGPHMSGFFFLYRMRPHLRIGVETLVANSDQDAATTMNYQAAGPVVELSYGSTWPVGLWPALWRRDRERDGPSGPRAVGRRQCGSYYKGSGGFLAPYVGIGRRFGRNELGAYVKPVMTFGESDRGGLTDFGAWFGGVRYAFSL